MQVPVGDYYEEDFAPGLFILLVFVLGGILVAFVFASIAAAILGAMLLGLTGAGILSVSIGMGLYKRSFYTGFKWFVYLSFSFCGIGGVALIALLVHIYGPKTYTFQTMLSWGIPAGFIGGLIAGWAVLFTSRKLYAYFAKKNGLLQA